MKYSLIALSTVLLIIACNQDDKKAETKIVRPAATVQNNAAAVDSANLTTIEWLGGKEQNLGKIIEGQKMEVAFRFKNNGDKPLVVSKAWAGCGCTVPDQLPEPVLPGEEGVIKATFSSENRGGTNTKEVYVNTNTDPVTNVLVFTVEVLRKENKN